MRSFALYQGLFVAIGGEDAALEEVVVALEFYDCELGIDTRRFVELLQLVAKVSGDSTPRFIVGENAFIHEPGIHVDGLLKDPKPTSPSLRKMWQHCFVVAPGHPVCNLREHDVELGKEEAQLVLVSTPIGIYTKQPPTVDTIPH